MSESIHLLVSHAGRSLPLSLPLSSPLSSLLATLESHFSVDRSTLKFLSKAKKISLESPEATLREVIDQSGIKLSSDEGTSSTKPLKLLLIGPKSEAIEALREVERTREKKHAAFQHHQTLSSFAKPTKSRGVVHGLSSEDPERYRFYELQPFPTTVPQFEKRKAMLERLAKDEAVRDLMLRHKFAVGVLTELHPILQPTLLGLNTNHGEKVSLRLLTDDLEGTRNYNEVRRVLLHELAHNRFGDHNDDFKELNSRLNKEVSEFESSPYFEPWSPTSSSTSDHQAHRLNEETAENVWEQLNFGLEEEVELKRDRIGRAAEERMKREKGSRS